MPFGLPVDSWAATQVGSGNATASHHCSWATGIWAAGLGDSPSVTRTLFDQARGRETLNQRNDPDLPAPGLDLSGAHDGLGFVIPAFDEYIGLYGNDELQWRGLVEDHHGIDGGQSSQHSSAIAFAHDGAVWPLQTTHRGIAIDRHNETIAATASLFEQGDVADMQKIETTVGKDDALSIGLPERCALDDLFARQDAIFGVEGNLR